MKKIYGLLICSLIATSVWAQDSKPKTINDEKKSTSKEQEGQNNSIKKDVKDKASKVKLLRLDLISVGVPNRIIGIGPEVLLPIPVPAIRNKFAVYGNYSPVAFIDLDASSLGDNAKANLSTYEIGVNYYIFNKRGSGLYVSGSYSNFNLALDNADISKLLDGFTGQVDAKLKQSGFNARIGIKAGNRVYFRFEVGYTRFIENTTAEFNGNVTTSDGNFTVSFNNSEVKVKDVLENTLGTSLPPISVNLGIGVSFFKDKGYNKRKINSLLKEIHN